jgi:shikimate kinase
MRSSGESGSAEPAVAAPPASPAVVLVGFMGAGKSAVGRELARRLGLPYLDTDVVITAEAGPVPAIFAERGEDGFRALEADIVVREIEALAAVPKVLALGGGAVLSERVRAALARQERVVWLTAPAEELWRRVARDSGASRPLARDEDAFCALLAAREPLYAEVATVQVATEGSDPAAVAARVSRMLSEAAEGAA